MLRSFAALFTCAAALLAQSNVASLTGIVTDSTGAVHTSAAVTITNMGTGIVTKTVTNEQGIFLAPSLQPGVYRVEISASGFKSYQVPSILLEAGQRRRLDVTLEVGSVTDRVEVTAAVTPLQQETAEVSETISSTEMNSLPLAGRSPYQVLALAPGVSTTGDNPTELEYDSASINGSRRRANSYVIDGASTTHIGGIAERLGSIEAIQEMKVLSSTYSAEFGRTAGGVVMFQVKSGSSNYHGSVYEYHRNSALNATNWENNARNIRQTALIRNEFGATFGGAMPWTNKRLFFFLSYEGLRDNVPSTRLRTIPDPSIRGGDFSRTPVTVNDPLTGQPFPGNVIPSNRLDPAAVRLLTLFPAPNVQGDFDPRFGIATNNFALAGSTSDAKNFGIMRWDFHPTDKQKFFVTFSHVNEGPRVLAIDFENVLNTQIGPRFRNIRRMTIGYTRFFSPSVTNEVLASAQRDPRKIEPWHRDFDVTQELGIVRRVGSTLPVIDISGGFGAFGDSRYQDWVHQPSSIGNITTVLRGSHTMRFGAQLFQNQFWYAAAENLSGTYRFNGEVTGLGTAARNNPINAFADLLLGAVKTAQYDLRQIPTNRYNYNFGAFFNDDWKLSRRLTLNLGLRYELETRQATKNNIYSRVNPVTGELLVAGVNASKNLNLDNDYLNLSPRIGMAYSLNDKTVIRTGFSMFYANFWVDNGEIVQYPGYTGSRSFTDPGAGRAQPFTFSQGFPIEGAAEVLNPLESFANATVANPLRVSAVTYQSSAELPYTMQWSFSVQRELGFNTALDVSYIGTRGRHLARGIPANNPGLERAAEVSVQRVPIQQVRPFPRYTGFNVVMYDANSAYESLQIKATRRFSAGFSVDANYTWSKNIDNASGTGDTFQIPWVNQAIERSLSSLDRPHMFTLGFVYDLPFGRGRKLFSENRVAAALLGGFQINGLISACDGLPQTITQNATNLILANQRPDVRDSSNLSGKVPEPVSVGASRQWLIRPNEPAFPFVRSGPTDIGNLGRNTTREPGFWNANLSVFRAIPFTESVGIQLRFEAFNALNHVNYLQPASSNIDNANYGLITAAAPARQVQIGARLYF
jgi:hypothetical protein